MKSSDKIIILLKKLGVDVPKNQKPYRLYHGHHQRSEGAWSWGIGYNPEWNLSFGSQWSMGYLLKAKYVILFSEYGIDVSLLPVEKDEYLKYVSEKKAVSND